jgi:hypothetical protein
MCPSRSRHELAQVVWVILIDMKKIWLALIALLAISSHQQVLAGDAYFGIGSFGFAYVPLPAIQIGYDFDSRSSGFGVRGAVMPFILLDQILIDAYYRVPLNEDGFNAYVGAGVGGLYLNLFGLTSIGLVYAHGLLGLAGNIDSDHTWFLEFTPGAAFVVIDNNVQMTSESRSEFYYAFAAGLNFPLR